MHRFERVDDDVDGSHGEAEHIDDGITDFRPALLIESGDQRTDVRAVDDANPLGLQHAGARKTIRRTERNLP